MYDALGNMENSGTDDSMKKLDNETISSNAGLYEVPDEIYDKKVPLDSNNYDHSLTGSAVLPPSSVIHRSSPQVQIRQIALNPTSVDTDKDTQFLVEEDKSEC
jgi:low density lipoprotein-related protein 2